MKKRDFGLALCAFVAAVLSSPAAAEQVECFDHKMFIKENLEIHGPKMVEFSSIHDILGIDTLPAAVRANILSVILDVSNDDSTPVDEKTLEATPEPESSSPRIEAEIVSCTKDYIHVRSIPSSEEEDEEYEPVFEMEVKKIGPSQIRITRHDSGENPCTGNRYRYATVWTHTLGLPGKAPTEAGYSSHLQTLLTSTLAEYVHSAGQSDNGCPQQTARAEKDVKENKAPDSSGSKRPKAKGAR